MNLIDLEQKPNKDVCAEIVETLIFSENWKSKVRI